MSDDLVKQPALRKWQESVYGKGPYQVPDYESMAAIVQEHEQMADRIEEMEAKLDLSEGALDVASKSWGECQRILEQTEAKLTKAVQALETIAGPHNWTSPHAGLGGSMDDDLRIVARTTLAELKGEDRG